VLPSLARAFNTQISHTSLAALIGCDELFHEGQLAATTRCRTFEVDELRRWSTWCSRPSRRGWLNGWSGSEDPGLRGSVRFRMA
jgi:hypothetical protein